ncbi:hypothetical protein ONZ51_g2582 [Trametes cubensis]|uniref:Thiolase n=1 Tax=Trametes cubensis TaxID=1111947 RepID=A0AAD7XBX2_9APHY|nr:hypothetical protein ONZ51_g2582 [Trametes cubensis]
MSYVPSDAELVSAFHNIFIVICSGFSAVALLLFHNLVTLEEVVYHLRKPKLTGSTVLFLANQYLPLAVALYFAWGWSGDATICKREQILGTVLEALQYIPWAVFSALRLYALQRNVYWASIVFLFSLSPLIFNFANRDAVVGHLHGSHLWLLSAIYCSCSLAIFLCVVVILIRLPTILADIIVIIATWTTQYSSHRLAQTVRTQPALSTVALRDGVVYFILLLVLNTCRMVFDTLQLYTIDDGDCGSILAQYVEPLTAVLVSYFLINLRQAADATRVLEETTIAEEGTLEFRIIGSMGASLPGPGEDGLSGTLSINPPSPHPPLVPLPLPPLTTLALYAMSSFTQRIQNLTGTSPKAKALAQHDDDVVIVAAVRSAITKAKKGGFKDTRPEEILSGVLRAVYTKAGVNPALIGDITVGNVLPAGGGATAARMAALHSGIPNTVPISTVNRQCASGLQAVNIIASQIAAGQIDLGIGAGVESMTFGYGGGAMPDGFSEAVLSNQEAEDCLLPMGITSENVAADFGISREAQDARRAKFKDEIVPLKVKWVDPKTEQEKEIVVDHDDGVRDGVTPRVARQAQARVQEGRLNTRRYVPSPQASFRTMLRRVYRPGNASQVSDGAAAVLLARRSAAKKLGLPIVGKFVAAAYTGVPPRIMGVGPAYAIPKVLEQTGLSKDDVDFYEINEAFASQAVFSVEKLGIPFEKVNVNGGAIAMGHPLGCTGARQVATGLNIAKQTGGKLFCTSMCIGSGMGMAALFVSEQ